MFITYIYIRFNQYLNEKSLKAVKHLHAVFLLTLEQRRRPIRLEKAMVYFYVTDVALLEYK